jgi:HlyD family secretion protein
MEKEKIELQSEELQEVLGAMPNKLIRYGITVVFSVLFIIILGTCFISYPDIISAEVTLVSENPPAAIVARSSAKIDHLLISDNHLVSENQILAVLENTANFKQVYELQKQLRSFEISKIDNYVFDIRLKLGNLQSDYLNFVSLLKAYKDFKEIDYHAKKIDILKVQKTKQEQHLSNTIEQHNLKEQDNNIQFMQVKRDSILYSKKYISTSEYESAERKKLQTLIGMKQSESSISRARMDIVNIESQIKELRLQKLIEEKEKLKQLVNSLNSLQNKILVWEKQFVLKSPIEGKVSFNSFWHINQQVQAGETVFSIVPKKENLITGKILLSAQGVGKIEKGQRVNIKFFNYPSNEFGFVKTKLENLSLVPTKDGNYTATVMINKALVTSYNKTLKFQQGMKGIADIITDEHKLIERFINPIKKILSENLN